ncbi:hypothetical protein COCOBI_01-6620 [Coccomyxa sp. Obi]|nr:hypothetical protein COCOBI_01-6620 [Coccomyxa sp. Obi]
MSGPALPWGNAGVTSTSDVEQRQIESSEQKHARLDTGERIRVLWELTDDDGQSTTKWWGAVVKSDVNDVDTKTILRYDAHENFEEEEVEVEFISSEHLKDCNTEAELYWMREAEYDEEADDDVEENGDATISTEEIVALTGGDGPSLDAEAMQRLQDLPMDKQLQMAEGYRRFIDHMAEQLRAKAQANSGQPYVVTEADVHEAFSGLARK